MLFTSLNHWRPASPSDTMCDFGVMLKVRNPDDDLPFLFSVAKRLKILHWCRWTNSVDPKTPNDSQQGHRANLNWTVINEESSENQVPVPELVLPNHRLPHPRLLLNLLDLHTAWVPLLWFSMVRAKPFTIKCVQNCQRNFKQIKPIYCFWREVTGRKRTVVLQLYFQTLL